MANHDTYTHIGQTAAQSPTLDRNSDRLLTAAELAGILRMHPVSIRRLALAGKIPALHIGRSVRFRIADVLEAIESREGSRNG